MTPMMTPMGGHIMTPAQHPVATPSLGQTPAHPITTPAQTTITTPQYQPTPRGQWPSTGPGSTTPRSQGGPSQGTPSRTPTRTPQQQTPSGNQRGTPSSTSQDWAKMAEQWARKRQSEQPPRRRTPRPGQSPMDMATPGGDTPLFDER